MKFAGGLLMAIALLLLVGLALGPQASPVLADEHEHEHEHGEGLGESMDQMNGLFRQVRRSARDASKNEETAEKLARLTALVIQGKDYPPHMISQVPEDQRDELMRSYRLIMIELAQAFLNAEAAILEDRNDDAWEHLLEANEIKGRGHELFLPEDDD